MNASEESLAKRLGLTVHVSPLRIKLQRLRLQYPSSNAACLEDWLLDVANARNARVVLRHPEPSASFVAPSATILPNEELIVAICQPLSLDRPQSLRAAAQLVSRGAVDPLRLVRTARRERAGIVLAELARQALTVDGGHAVWRVVERHLGQGPRPRDPILHWTRLAEPVPTVRHCNAARWKLVA